VSKIENLAQAAEPNSKWWSALQAFTWMVLRNDGLVRGVKPVRSLYDLRYGGSLRWTDLAPVDDPSGAVPISIDSAPAELAHAASIGKITLYGRKGGAGPSVPIPTQANLEFRDEGGQLLIHGTERTAYASRKQYWSDLSVLVTDCKACWPSPDSLPLPGRTDGAPAQPPVESAAIVLQGLAKPVEHAPVPGQLLPKVSKRGAGNKPYVDEPLIVRGLEGMTTGAYKSALAAADAMADEIEGGGTLQSKVRRLANKIRQRAAAMRAEQVAEN
jgi:hypothetical protein